MILEQFYLGCLAQASYFIADEASGEAAIVDPRRDVDEYLQEAADRGLTIKHVILTHFHADFLAGHLELREKTGAEIHLGAKGEADFPVTPAHDGDVIEVGAVRLKILETPGHTPESICIVVEDPAKPGVPHAVLTGDTLFIGDVGRPDLMASIGVTAEELGGMLYDSLHTKLLPLPDATLLYPGHGAGSMCGKNLSKDTVSTIGDQRVLNYALQPMSKEKFIALVAADQPESPAYFAYDADLNRRERATLEDNLAQRLKPLTWDAVETLAASGAQLLDVRSADQFTAAHIRDSINIGLGGQYATWAGTLLNREQPIVLLGDAGQETEAATRLGRIGFDNLAGYLENGVSATLRSHPELQVSVERLDATALNQALHGDNPPVVVDVRGPGERDTAHIEGTLFAPLNHLPRHLADIPRDRPVVVHCAGGYRSCIALSLLLKDGRTPVTDLIGGIGAWRAAGFPVAEPASAS